MIDNKELLNSFVKEIERYVTDEKNDGWPILNYLTENYSSTVKRFRKDATLSKELYDELIRRLNNDLSTV